MPGTGGLANRCQTSLAGKTFEDENSWRRLIVRRVQDIQQRSGLPVSPHYGASKIHWLLADLRSSNRSRVPEADICIGPLASFLLFNLIEDKTVCQVDHANGGRTQLMNFEKREWDDALLDLFDVPKSMLPVARPTHFEFGKLTGTEIPVQVCQGDQTAAVFGYGNLPTGTAHVNLGTGGFVLSPVSNLKRVREHAQLPLLISLADSTQQSADYFLEGTINGAGSAIKWAAKHLGLKSVETSLDAWAEETEHPPLFFNSVGGIGSPIWNATPPAELANLWFDHGLEPIPIKALRASEAMIGVLESIVFLVAMNIDAMRELGVEPKTLRLSGGVTASRSLCQKLSDLTHCRIVRPHETESTLLGVAQLLIESSAGSESFLIKTSTNEISPRPNPQIQRRYELFQQLMSEIPISFL